MWKLELYGCDSTSELIWKLLRSIPGLSAERPMIPSAAVDDGTQQGPQFDSNLYSSVPSLRAHSLLSQMASAHPLKGPLLPVATDDKVAAHVASAQPPPPPSYQATSPAEAAPPPPPAHRCDRRRRCFRRFGHFLIGAILLWFAARYIVRHCELRRFAPGHHDDEFPWVRSYAKDAGLIVLTLDPVVLL